MKTVLTALVLCLVTTPALAADPAPTAAARREFATKLGKSVRDQGVNMWVTTTGADADGLLVKTGGEECTKEFATALLRQIGAAALRVIGFDGVGCVDSGEHSEWAMVPQR